MTAAGVEGYRLPPGLQTSASQATLLVLMSPITSGDVAPVPVEPTKAISYPHSWSKGLTQSASGLRRSRGFGEQAAVTRGGDPECVMKAAW